MTLRPMPHYALVKCNIKEQKERKEKHGFLHTHPDHQFMIYNMEWGEIVAIGSKYSEIFPEAKPGHTLIFHHFVQGLDKRDSQKDHLIHEDETYHYYVVTAEKFEGKKNETYGVWDGEKIIPHPEFVFMEIDRPTETYATPDDYINSAMQVGAGGLLVFKEWKRTREDIEAELDRIKKENENLAITGADKPAVRTQIMKNEEEMMRLQGVKNAIQFLPYTVSFANPLLSQWFDFPINPGQILYIDSRAAEKTVSFKDKKYRVVPVNFIGWMPNPIKE